MRCPVNVLARDYNKFTLDIIRGHRWSLGLSNRRWRFFTSDVGKKERTLEARIGPWRVVSWIKSEEAARG